MVDLTPITLEEVKQFCFTEPHQWSSYPLWLIQQIYTKWLVNVPSYEESVLITEVKTAVQQITRKFYGQKNIPLIRAQMVAMLYKTLSDLPEIGDFMVSESYISTFTISFNIQTEIRTYPVRFNLNFS
jgi:hypothetical protein